MGYKEFVAKIMKSFDVLRARFEPLRSGVELTKDWVVFRTHQHINDCPEACKSKYLLWEPYISSPPR